MLLSKRAEMFLPEHWPAYFQKSRDCFVWDLDGNKYLDMSTMSIGTNILGYGDPDVDEAVISAVRSGNMSSLNCPEEVSLAERLIELHPWADMVRFSRSGGEANAIAIRIARAASGKDGVAICGYHGWHDWYLAANLASDNHLAGHLMPGLEPNGVPANLSGTIFPFEYNNLEQLSAIVQENSIGVIKMEVCRNTNPQPGFLKSVRELATRHGIVLIFDECTSGFRQSLGGIHKVFGVNPDMAVFGKALGNGYAITAVLGSQSVMQAAQSTFISSTFWTERIGPSAALATLVKMEETASWEYITNTGSAIKQTWKCLADTYGLSLNISGIDAIPSFAIDSPNALAYKTLITQQMLKSGILASTLMFVSIRHTQEHLDRYYNSLDDVFSIISKCESNLDVFDLLDGPVCHAGFKRLN